MTPELLRLLAGEAARFRGLRYGGGYVPGRHVDCCGFTASVIHLRYGWGDPDLPATRRGPRWADLCVWDAARRWSPIDRIVADVHAGSADELAAGPHLPGPVALWPGQLHLVQGWSGSAGHAWLWAADALDPTRGWVVESSQVGPRVWCGAGKVPLADVRPDMPPMPWATRAAKWAEVAWVLLP